MISKEGKMKFEIVLTERIKRELWSHLLDDRSREQMAVTLCGVSHDNGTLKLLCRHLILMPHDAFVHQSAGGLELRQQAQSYVLEMAAREGLSQVDWHSHPGGGFGVGFSGIDDHHEKALAGYLAERIPHTYYASVVVNDTSIASRIWLVGDGICRPISVERIVLGGLEEQLTRHSFTERNTAEERFSRQVLAFGQPLQDRISRLKVGVVGLGGLGSILVEELCRLGVNKWVLVDDDYLEESNLNRVTASTLRDAQQTRSKVSVAMRNIQRINPQAYVSGFQASALEIRVLRRLKTCDFLAVCTDNNSSRLVLNHLSAQYLIPLLHLGYAIDTDRGEVTEVSGEYAITSPGEWCLFCSGIVDSQGASRELAAPQELAILRERGYVSDTPAPAVYHLDGIIVSLAVAEVHNLAHSYKQQRRYLAYDDLKGELVSLTVEPQEMCPVCSPEGILGLGDLEPLPDYLSFPDRGLSLPDASIEEDVDSEEEAEVEQWDI